MWFNSLRTEIRNGKTFVFFKVNEVIPQPVKQLIYELEKHGHVFAIHQDLSEDQIELIKSNIFKNDKELSDYAAISAEDSYKQSI